MVIKIIKGVQVMGKMPDKIPISFKNTLEEQELLNWIKEKSKILGQGNFIKDILYKEMLKDKAAKK